MTDVYCPRCGEPWDMEELHYVTLRDVAQLARRLYPDNPDLQGRLVKSVMIRIQGGEIFVVFEHAYALFTRYGCWVFGNYCEPQEDSEIAARARIVYEMLGPSDPDGAAALLNE